MAPGPWEGFDKEDSVPLVGPSITLRVMGVVLDQMCRVTRRLNLLLTLLISSDLVGRSLAQQNHDTNFS